MIISSLLLLSAWISTCFAASSTSKAASPAASSAAISTANSTASTCFSNYTCKAECDSTLRVGICQQSIDVICGVIASLPKARPPNDKVDQLLIYSTSDATNKSSVSPELQFFRNPDPAVDCVAAIRMSPKLIYGKTAYPTEDACRAAFASMQPCGYQTNSSTCLGGSIGFDYCNNKTRSQGGLIDVLKPGYMLGTARTLGVQANDATEYTHYEEDLGVYGLGYGTALLVYVYPNQTFGPKIDYP